MLLGKNIGLSILQKRFMPKKFPQKSKSAPPCIAYKNRWQALK
jgi:hypothetical protein